METFTFKPQYLKAMSSIANNALKFQRDLLTVQVFPSTQQMGGVAAEEVAAKIVELLDRQPEVNLIFAAAPSQEEFLSRLIADPRIDWGRINAFHMDEYIGIDARAPQSFGNFLRQRIFDRVPFRSVHYLDGSAPDLEAECRRYSELLERYPTDIVCLGIGENGHIAFNDPGVADFHDPALVKVVTLDVVCRQQQVNEKCFETFDQVPAKALTLTIPALLRADWLFCIVPFRNKANAVREALYGEISERCPASILRIKENSCLYLNHESAQRINP